MTHTVLDEKELIFVTDYQLIMKHGMVATWTRKSTL